MKKQITCPECKKKGCNQFSDPYNVENISIYHSKRYDTEYYFKCPHCGGITIYPKEPE